jgi:hypothetical protein
MGTMLLTVTAFCIWLALHMRAVERQRTAVAGITELGGQCFYDYQLRPDGLTYGNLPPPGPAWLRERLGIDHLANVDCIVLWDPQTVGTALRWLKDLPTCRRLYLQFNETRLTDEELADLAMLKQLREFGIQSPRQTDRILSALEPLTNLESFTIAGRAEGISDDGVAHLAGLKSLRRLVLANQEHQAGITDRGLARLRGLTRLRELDLSGNKVTASGVSELQKSLPNCKIVW